MDRRVVWIVEWENTVLSPLFSTRVSQTGRLLTISKDVRLCRSLQPIEHVPSKHQTRVVPECVRRQEFLLRQGLAFSRWGENTGMCAS